MTVAALNYSCWPGSKDDEVERASLIFKGRDWDKAIRKHPLFAVSLSELNSEQRKAFADYIRFRDQKQRRSNIIHSRLFFNSSDALTIDGFAKAVEALGSDSEYCYLQNEARSAWEKYESLVRIDPRFAGRFE